MRIADHMEKVERLSELRGQLDPLGDFEIWMWTSMTVATNAVNAVMHHLGITAEGDYYAHQIPGLYVVPPPQAGVWERVILPPGDVIHVGFPPIRGAVPARLQQTFAALTVLEDMREPYVRGDGAITPALVESCRRAFDDCLAGARALLAEAQKPA